MVIQVVPMLIGLAGAAASGLAQNLRQKANERIEAAKALVDAAERDFELRKAAAQQRLEELSLYKGQVARFVIPQVLEAAERLAPVESEAIADASERLEPLARAQLQDMRQVVEAVRATSSSGGSSVAVNKTRQGFTRMLAQSSSNPALSYAAGGAMAALGLIDLGAALFGARRGAQSQALASEAAEDIRARMAIFGAVDARIDELSEATRFAAESAFIHAFMILRIVESERSPLVYAALNRPDRERVLMFFEFAQILWRVLGLSVLDGGVVSEAVPKARRITSKEMR